MPIPIFIVLLQKIMEYKETDIKGVWVIEPKVFNDARGYFFEAWKKEEFESNTENKIDYINKVFSEHENTADYIEALYLG